MSPRYRVPAGDQDLDPLLDPTRLAMVSLLTSTEWCGFGFVGDSIELTDPAYVANTGRREPVSALIASGMRRGHTV